jgi:hypothetical protein
MAKASAMTKRAHAALFNKCLGLRSLAIHKVLIEGM